MMFDTNITIVGTVLTQPEKRITTKTNALVTSFRVVTNARRFDRESQRWIDGANLRIKVSCWRRIAEGVLASVNVGDPVIVYGRIATRDWKTEQGEARISYEVEADNVGHDLSRGQAIFRKTRIDPSASVVEDADSDNRVNGEPTEPFSTMRPGPTEDEIVHDDDESYDDFGYGAPEAGTEFDAMTILREAGLDPHDEEGGDEETDEEAMAGAAASSGGAGSRSRRRGRQPVPA